MISILKACLIPLIVAMVLLVVALAYQFHYIWPIIIFAVMDIKSRLSEYFRIRRTKLTEKKLKAMAQIYQYSRCQRDAFLAALEGYELELGRAIYQKYKWYHILPEWAYSNPGYFFTKDFWRTFFK